MTAESSTTLKTYFQTGDTPTEAQFVNLIDSAPNSVDIAAATGSDVVDDALSSPFTPDEYRLVGVGPGGGMTAFPMGQMFIGVRQYERTFKISDYHFGYPSNNPLLEVTSGDPDAWDPQEQVYDPDEHDSSQAFYDALTQMGSAYSMTGFTLLVDSGFWCLQTMPTGSSTPIITGTVQSSTSGTVVLDSGASSSNFNYNGCVIEITSGTGVGQVRRINNYTGGSRTVTNAQAWGTNPANGDAYAIRRAYILPLMPRMTLRSTGGWVNSAIIRGPNCNGDLFGSYQPVSAWQTQAELRDILIQDITLNGGREYAYQGGSNDADTIATWDVVHFEKLRSAALGDARFRLLDCYIRGAIRHPVYYQGRGDSYICRNRIGSCGDSGIRVESTTDWHMTDNIISGTGRHAVHISDSSGCEFSNNAMYFVGQNTLNRWDGSTRTSVREHGSAMKITNCNNIRGTDNRIEDTSGHCIWITSAGDALRIHGTYFHNPGCIGSNEDNTDGYADFGFPNITTSNRNGTDENKNVDGVDVVFFDDQAAGTQYCNGLEITGWIRQARSNQYTRRLVTIQPVNTRAKTFTDCLIDIQPGYQDQSNIVRNILDAELWAAVPAHDFHDVEFYIEPSTSRPVPFDRCRMNFMGRPMDGFGNRVRNLRSEPLNMWESAAQFALSVAAVSANITAAVWSVSNSVNRVTYTVDANLTGTLTTKHAVRIAGAANAAHNGVYNIDAITSTTIRVINMGIVDATDDFTGGSATATGPVAEIVLGRDAVDGQVYRIGVASMDGSAEDLVIRSLDTNIDTTIGTVTSKRFSKDPYTGWYEVV
jgi:parallel beta-helix repeat protein